MPTKQWQPPAGDPVVSSWQPPAGDRLLGAPALKAGPDTAEPAAPGSLQDILGMGSNIANNAVAGAGFGSMAGPVGTGVGAIAGGLSGLFQKPSDAPGADLGALGGSLAASLVPGGKLIKGGAQVLGTSLGAYLGSKYGDRALGTTKDVDGMRVGIYATGATLGALLGAVARDMSPTAEAAARLKSTTGTEVPLSVSEGTGSGQGNLTSMFAPRADMRNLSQAQSAALKSAMGKLVNAPTDQWLGVIDQATKTQGDVQDIISKFAKDYKAANVKNVTTTVPSGAPGGSPLTITQQIHPTDVNWNDLQKLLGWNDEEREMVFRAIKASPEAFVNQLAPTTSQNPEKGLIALSGFMKALQGSGKPAEAALLGQAVIMRDLRPALTTDVNGTKLAQLIDNGMRHWSLVLNSKQLQGLQDLAQVARDADPLPKLTGTNVTDRAASYLNTKVLFGTASLAASGLMGHEGMAAAPVWLLGTAGGVTLALGIGSMFGKVLADPAVGKLLVRANQGDQKAMSALVRSVSSSVLNQGNTQPSPVSRLAGFMTGSGQQQ